MLLAGGSPTALCILPRSSRLLCMGARSGRVAVCVCCGVPSRIPRRGGGGWIACRLLGFRKQPVSRRCQSGCSLTLLSTVRWCEARPFGCDQLPADKHDSMRIFITRSGQMFTQGRESNRSGGADTLADAEGLGWSMRMGAFDQSGVKLWVWVG